VRGEDVEPPATAGRRTTHDDLEHRLLVSMERRDHSLLGRRLVAPRPVREHVAHRRDPETAELAPNGRPDAREGLDRSLEDRGLRQ
jgi:hypothetical protein